MRTAEEIRLEIARLEAEADSAHERDRRREEQSLEAEKHAEIARSRAAELAVQRSLEAHERRMVEDVERAEAEWRELRENCYRPAPGRLGSLGLCDGVVSPLRNQDIQVADWCSQCQYGYANPNYSPALKYPRRG